MRSVFLTGNDQIIDLNDISAIETETHAVIYHLKSGTTIKSQRESRDDAAEEKWAAFRQLTAGVTARPNDTDRKRSIAAARN
jgi:hypothetical protein